MSGDGEHADTGEPTSQGGDQPVPVMEPDFDLVGPEVKASREPDARANVIELNEDK